MAWCLYPLFRQTVVALPAVRAHLRAGFDCGRDKGNQTGAGDIVDPRQAYTAEALGRQYLDGNSDDELALGAASTHALFDAAHIGLIDFDRAVKAIPPRPHHGGAQLLQHGPCGLIASQSQQPLQPQCAHPMLLMGHVPRRGKPCRERNAAAIQDRARSHRYFPSTSRAGPTPVGRAPSFCASAFRTAEAPCPPQPFQIRDAGRLVGKPNAKLRPRPRIGRINRRRRRIICHYL